MQDTTTVWYIMRQPELLAEPAQLERLVQELVQRGYLLVARQEERAAWLAWMLYQDPDWPGRGSAADRAEKQALAAPYRERIFTPGVTEQLRRELDLFETHQQGDLHVYAKAVARSGALFQHEFDLRAPVGRAVAVHYSHDFFTIKRNERARVEAFDHWLGIVEALYALLRPLYAYSWNHNNEIPLTDDTYLEQCRPYTLYTLNLFGPEMVEQLGGRTHVLKTPAQFVRPLADGGVLVIPELHWYPGSLPYTWTKVARHLGVLCPECAVDDDDDDS